MNMDKDTQEKLQELQMIEHNIQNISMQKQAFQIELSETESSLEEVEKSGEDIYKITGQIMIKAKKTEIAKELKEKKELLNLRLKTIVNQEKVLSEKVDNLRKSIDGKIKSSKQ